MHKLRFWVPNALTAAGIGFAALAIRSAVDGNHRTAAWWALFTVLTDKADGAVARALRASSSFGAQLDSFADFFSFGVVPATLFYCFFSRSPSAGWSDEGHRLALTLLSFFYVLCVAARLARFNLTTELPGAERFFFGVPTTYTGGLLVSLFVMLLKYGDPAWTATDPAGDHWLVLGASTRLDGLMPLFPWLLLPAGVGMVSKLRMPKLGRTGRLSLDALQVALIAFGYGVGLAHRLTEYFVAGAIGYFAVTLRYHFTSEAARAVALPPLFEEPEVAANDAGQAHQASG